MHKKDIEKNQKIFLARLDWFFRGNERAENMKLELGCGNKRVCSDSIGIDISKDSKCDIVADVHYLPFIERSFDESIMFEVLEHLHSPYLAIKEIGRVSKSIVISIPNRFYFRNTMRWFFKGKLNVDKGHIYAWTLPEISNLLEKCGFTIEYLSFTTTHHHSKHKLQNVLPRIMSRSLVIKATEKKESWKLENEGFRRRMRRSSQRRCQLWLIFR